MINPNEPHTLASLRGAVDSWPDDGPDDPPIRPLHLLGLVLSLLVSGALAALAVDVLLAAIGL